MNSEVSFELKEKFISPWKRSQNTFDRFIPEPLRRRFLSNSRELQTNKVSAENLPSNQSINETINQHNYKPKWFHRANLHRPLFKFWGVCITKGFVLFFSSVLIAYVVSGIIVFKTEEGKPLTKKTGFLVSLAGFLVFTFAAKKSFWAFAVGLEFDKALLFHKISASLMISFAVVHWWTSTFKLTGYLLLSNAILISGFAFYKIRRSYFRLFYLSHVIFILSLVVIAVLHEATFVLVGFLCYAFDVLLRMIQIRGYRKKIPKAHLVLKSENVIEISFQAQNFFFKPGQWTFVLFPDISVWEFHPFSINWNIFEERIRLNSKVSGDWTLRLFNLASQKKEVEVWLDGPYGSLSLDISDPKYQQFLLIGGGIGVTPLLSIANGLLEDFLNKRTIRIIKFVWAVKTVSEIRAVLNESDILIQILNAFYQEEEFLKASETKNILDLQIFVTSQEKIDLGEPIFSAIKQNLRFKKLNISSPFYEMKDISSESNDLNVAVIGSGPRRLIEDVFRFSKLCKFDVSCESFEF